ncbi:transcription initiation factor TFIID subunit 7-like [Salvia hispanica]|uniref:transcription initiation factor TFIID subunit 7-like n=1 Tax=Salvia hispanica TaxID=49212 RepID=UPI0020096B4A|nr:transcription initiation factor TFIID subunit 7-like [Salvia hispanica]
MSLHHNLPPAQNPQNPHHIPPPQQQRHSPMAALPYPKSKNQSLTLSDDDESGFTADDGKRRVSPWQRMKWTDNMVRLLIMVVFYIGDEVGAAEAGEAGGKKKGGGVLQKKGKWKSVSRAMMERGFYVSPQQCEDKFNDLNKRYKRVNDILGKGTSCRVVENQSLLDSMDLAPKVKDEVKKLLNSKHLYFREMCAYHNSCGGGAMQHSQSPPPTEMNAAACLHAAVEKTPNLNRGGEDGTKLRDEDEFEEDDVDDGDDDADDDEQEDDVDDDEQEDDVNDERLSSRKRARTRKGAGTMVPLAQHLDAEMAREGGRTMAEKRQWLKGKMVALEEERLGIHSQSFQLEKQRLKWLKFSSKKEREMEREKLINERTKLENERMLLLIRHKELDLMEHQSSNKKTDPSSITG